MKGKHYLQTVLMVTVFVYAFLALGAMCSGTNTHELEIQAANKAYAAEQVACSAKHDAAHMEEALRCREEVRVKWGVYEDGGRRD